MVTMASDKSSSGDRGDLIRLLFARLLAEHEAILRRPRPYQMQRAAAAERAVVAAAQRLAINGHDLARRTRPQGLGPRRQATQELVGVQPLGYTRKRVGRGDAATQAQVPAEPVQLLPSVTRQILPSRSIHTRVCQTFQVFQVFQVFQASGAVQFRQPPLTPTCCAPSKTKPPLADPLSTLDGTHHLARMTPLKLDAEALYFFLGFRCRFYPVRFA